MKHETQIGSEKSAMHSTIHYKTIEEPRIPVWLVLVILVAVVGVILAFATLPT